MSLTDQLFGSNKKKEVPGDFSPSTPQFGSKRKRQNTPQGGDVVKRRATSPSGAENTTSSVVPLFSTTTPKQQKEKQGFSFLKQSVVADGDRSKKNDGNKEKNEQSKKNQEDRIRRKKSKKNTTTTTKAKSARVGLEGGGQEEDLAATVQHLLQPVAPVPKTVGEFEVDGGQKGAKNGKDKKLNKKKHLSHFYDPIDTKELNRTVFVSNLPNDVTHRDLKKFFSQCGDVESARVRCQMLETPKDGKDIGRAVRILKKEIMKGEYFQATGYVVFKDTTGGGGGDRRARAVQAAIRLTGSMFMNRHICITGEDEQSKLFDPRNSLYLGNLPYDVTDEEIWQFFLTNGISDIEKIRVPRDRNTGYGQGFAYVAFTRPSLTNHVISSMRGLEIRKRGVRICHVQKSKKQRQMEGQGGTRREKREQYHHQHQAGSNKVNPKKNMKHDDGKEQFQAKKEQRVGEEMKKESWMGMVTNPRKKIPRDLRFLATNDAERKRLRNANKPQAGGKPAKKSSKED